MRSATGRRVLITGAARGVGAALARRLSERGARVALCGLEPDALAEVADYRGAPWRECDVGDRTAVERAVDELVGALGGLDVVVANAGVARQLALVGGDIVSPRWVGPLLPLRMAVQPLVERRAAGPGSPRRWRSPAPRPRTPLRSRGSAREGRGLGATSAWPPGCRRGSPAPVRSTCSSCSRHRRLFRGWLRFAGRLMPRGLLPSRETELVILRVAHLRDCAY